MSQFVWIDETGEGSNVYALFRKSFELQQEPAEADLHIFADTRYRLMVNGTVIGHGPARFYVKAPRYDTWDIAAFLEPGENVVAVVVNSYGRASFHSEASIGGLKVWGSVADGQGGEVALDTDGVWRAVRSPGHHPETAKLSFALNQGEMLDLRDMPGGWAEPGFDDSAWPAAVPLADQDHWGELKARRMPLLDERFVRARRRIGTHVARCPEGEDRYSFAMTERPHAERGGKLCAAFTWIHSPREQTVDLGAFWGDYWLNGRKLEGRERDDVKMREDYRAELHKGWNALVVLQSTQCVAWEFYLAVPSDAGLELSAEKEQGSENTFLLAGPWNEEDVEAVRAALEGAEEPGALPEERGPWRHWPRGRRAESAYVERCRKMLSDLPGDDDISVAGASYADAVDGQTLVLTYDFDGEVLGRPTLDLTAAPGTVVDLIYSESAEDGCVTDVGTHHIRMGERFITAGGRQTVQTFHPRGMRYLEVSVEGDLAAFELHDVGMTRALYPACYIGDFECSDGFLNDLWEMGRDTLQACMEDAYLDCPWRERGLYSGDFLVQFYVNLATFGDVALFRRCIEVFLDGQGPDGWIRPGAHGLQPGKLPDYTATLVMAMWAWYERTGDLEFIRERADGLRKCLSAFDTTREPGGVLHDCGDLRPYIDRSPVDKEGVSCGLNCFFQRAYEVGGRLLGLIGDQAGAAQAAQKARRLAGAIPEAFWDAERGVFLDRRPEDVDEATPSVPANVLPLTFGIAREDQVQPALDYVRECMADNFLVEEPEKPLHQHVTTYFSHYAIGLLTEHGHTFEALEFMRKYYGWMMKKGAWTIWEFFSDFASLCHAWGASPTYYLSSHVLGISLPEPGNPNKLRISPNPGDLQWAAGTWPHPAGPVRVEWEVVGERLLLDYAAPQGVEVEIGIPDEEEI